MLNFVKEFTEHEYSLAVITTLQKTKKASQRTNTILYFNEFSYILSDILWWTKPLSHDEIEDGEDID